MSVPPTLEPLFGVWHGENSLWFSPESPAHVSDTSALIAAEGNDDLLGIRYRWQHDGTPHTGLVLLTYRAEEPPVVCVFTDSFHTAGQPMEMDGGVDAEGVVTVRGTYAAPPGPDWGWHISVSPPVDDRFTLRMYNVTPEGTSALAVEATYARSA